MRFKTGLVPRPLLFSNAIQEEYLSFVIRGKTVSSVTCHVTNGWLELEGPLVSFNDKNLFRQGHKPAIAFIYLRRREWNCSCFNQIVRIPSLRDLVTLKEQI
jgi:hypothetical protein